MIHADTVRAICERLPGSRMSLLAGEGHFAVYTSDSLQDKVMDFLSHPPLKRPGGQPRAPAAAI